MTWFAARDRGLRTDICATDCYHSTSRQIHAFKKPMNDDSSIAAILQTTRRIAVVGASTRPTRHSHRVMTFMQQHGYTMLPVNPVYAGQEVLGETVAATLGELSAPADMVNVFRRPEALEETVDDVLAVAEALQIRVVWMQLGLADEELAARVRSAGLSIVMDRCLKIEYGRLMAGA